MAITQKFTEWSTVCVCCNKNRDAAAIRCLRTGQWWQMGCWNVPTLALYLSIRESSSMIPISVTCFNHNSCSLHVFGL